jgi:cell division protein FtsB
LKRVANSYSAKNRSAQAVAVRSRTLPAGTRAKAKARAERWIPHIPNHVWLAMIILTFTALSASTYLRSHDAEREAVQSHALVSSRAENVKAANKQLKQQTEQIKTNPRMAEQAAQKQLRVLRPNEVVVARP